MMEVRTGCSQIKTRELASSLISIPNMVSAYTASYSIQRTRIYCTSRTIVAFIKVSMQVMTGSIYNTTFHLNLAFQSHSMLTILILCTSLLKTRLDVIMSMNSLRSIEPRMAAMSGK